MQEEVYFHPGRLLGVSVHRAGGDIVIPEVPKLCKEGFAVNSESRIQDCGVGYLELVIAKKW